MGRSVRKMKRKNCTTHPLQKKKFMHEIKADDGDGGHQKDAMQYCQLGEAFMQERQFLKAIPMLEKSIALDPNSLDVSLKIGRCYEKLKRYEKAIIHYERALELEPSSVEIRFSLAVSLQLLGLHKEAKEEYRKVLKADRNHVMARNNLAAIYLKEGEGEKAVEAFKELLQMEPHNHTFQTNLKVASGTRGNRMKKRKDTKKGISFCMVIREMEDETGHFLKTIAGWVDEVIIVDTGEESDRVKLTNDFKGTVVCHPWEEDFSVARNVALQHATCEWILVLHANERISKEGFSFLCSLINHQDFEGYRFIQRNYCDNPSLSGWVPCTDGHKQVWNSCGWIPTHPVKMFRNHEDIFFEGIIKERVDRSIYRKGGRIGKANILVHNFDCFMAPERKVGQEKYLLELGEKQLALTPHDLDLHYDLALRYARLHDFDQAIIRFKELRRLMPGHCGVCNDLGNAYFGKQDYQTAKSLYQQSLTLDPNFFQAHYNLANLLLMEGDLDGSWETYHQALTIHPECAQIFNNLGIICEKRGDDEEAITHCKQAINVNPFLPEAYNNLGVLYGRKGDRFNAEKSYCKAISLNTQYAEAYYNSRKLHLRGGEADKMKNIFEKAIS